MRLKLLILFGAGCWILAARVDAAVQFTKSSFEAAIDRAKSKKLPVMIDFFADWCGPCKLLDRKTWQDEQVSQLSRQFVCLKIDAEKGEGPQFADRFGIAAFPTIVFLDESGKEVHRESGFQPPSTMLPVMRRVLGQGGGLLRRAAEDPNDPLLQLEAARAAAASMDWIAARAALSRAKNLSGAQDPAFQADVLLLDGRLEAQRADWATACLRFQEFLQRFPQHTAALNARGELAHALVEAGKPQEALATYRDAIEQDPESVPALNAFAWFCATERIGLEEALPIARQAVQLSGRNPGVLDTLAELHFVRGEIPEALEVIAEAIRLEPGDGYYREQKARFAKAPASPVTGGP